MSVLWHSSYTSLVTLTFMFKSVDIFAETAESVDISAETAERSTRGQLLNGSAESADEVDSRKARTRFCGNRGIEDRFRGKRGQGSAESAEIFSAEIRTVLSNCFLWLNFRGKSAEKVVPILRGFRGTEISAEIARKFELRVRRSQSFDVGKLKSDMLSMNSLVQRF